MCMRSLAFRYIVYIIDISTLIWQFSPNCSFVFPSISIYLDKFVNCCETWSVLDIRNRIGGGKFRKICNFTDCENLCVAFFGSYKFRWFAFRSLRVPWKMFTKVSNNLRNCLHKFHGESYVSLRLGLHVCAIRYISLTLSIYLFDTHFGPCSNRDGVASVLAKQT